MNTKSETIEKFEPYEDQSSGSQKNRTTMNSIINDPKSGKQDFQIDLKMAGRFLTLLSEDVEDVFSFQTFDDKKESLTHPKVLHGSFEKHRDELFRVNRLGAGIFVTVNKTDGKGRSAENVTTVRAIFVDLDGSALQPVLDGPLSPHIIIESSPGRYHAYWITEGVDLAHFTPIQKKLCKRFNGDPAVCDLSRVMRLPGFFHQKGDPFLTKIIQESGEQPFSLEWILDAFEIDLSSSKEIEKHFNPVLEALTKQRMIISKQPHPMGCWTIRCPWECDHTTQDHGTKYYEPHTNGYAHHGFKCFHSHCADRIVKDLLQFLKLKEEIIEPLPLHRPISPPNPYPMEALGEILGSAAKALQSIIRAPDAICAQSVLGAAALACQAFANIEIDGRKIPLSLFLITVAESGERKSATDQVALQPVYAWQQMQASEYRAASQNYQRQYEVWEAQKKEFLKTIKKDEPASLFSIPEPVKPLEPLILVDEPTYEGVVKLLAVGQPSMGIFSDEGGRFVGGHAMNRDNQIKTISGLSSLWDGKPVNRSRAGEGTMILYGRRVSLHLMIQESILSQLMSDSGIEQQGFLPRCLLAFPASTAGNRPYAHQDANKNKDLIRYKDKINSLLDVKFPVDPPPAPQNELKIRSLSLSKDAKSAWVKFHDAIDRDLGPGGQFTSIRRFGSKSAEHVLRLAGILAMIDDPNVNLVEEQYIHMGIALVNYYLSETARVHGYLAIPHSLVLAQKVLDWCWLKDRGELTLRHLYQCGPNEVREAKKAQEIMKILEDHGWAQKLDDRKNSWAIRKQ